MKLRVRIKGGPGSGHHGHRGRPGKVGGSLPGKGGTAFGAVVPATLEEVSGGTYFDNNERAEQHLREGLGGSWQSLSYEIRSEVKDEIVADISNETGVPYDQVNSFIGQWAITSNNLQYASLIMQKSASEEFGVEMSDWQSKNLEDQMQWADTFVAPYWESEIIFSDKEKMRTVLRAMYDRTQKQLKEAGYDEDGHIVLFRGVGRGSIKVDNIRDTKTGDIVSYLGNAMESWSLSIREAEQFGSYVVAAKIPIRNILSTARTGYGCLIEGEFVVLMGGVPAEVTFFYD